MGNLSKIAKETLPEFQKYLLERKLVPEKNVPYFAYWVSRFLDFARKRDISATEYHEASIAERVTKTVRQCCRLLSKRNCASI